MNLESKHPHRLIPGLEKVNTLCPFRSKALQCTLSKDRKSNQVSETKLIQAENQAEDLAEDLPVLAFE